MVLGIDLGPLEVLVLVLTLYKLVLLTSDRYITLNNETMDFEYSDNKMPVGTAKFLIRMR